MFPECRGRPTESSSQLMRKCTHNIIVTYLLLNLSKYYVPPHACFLISQQIIQLITTQISSYVLSAFILPDDDGRRFSLGSCCCCDLHFIIYYYITGQLVSFGSSKLSLFLMSVRLFQRRRCLLYTSRCV